MFLILSLQNSSDPEVPEVSPRGLTHEGEMAVKHAREVQRSRYNEHVKVVIVYELPFGGGWDPGDFRDPSPYILYRAERTRDGRWQEQFQAYDHSLREA